MTVTRMAVEEPPAFDASALLRHYVELCPNLFRRMDELPTGSEPEKSPRFPRTQWSIVLRARDKANAPAAKRALDDLCETYWYPLYAFARGKGKSHHDAKDLTQGFFLYLLAIDLFADADPSKGKLRTFLLTAFSRYLIRVYHHENSGIAGGGRIVSLDEKLEQGERIYEAETAVDQNPVSFFDRSWAKSVLDAAKEVIRGEEAANGKVESFQVLQVFLEPDRGQVHSYEAVAARLGLRQEALRQVVSRLRKRYGQAVRAQIAGTLDDPTKEAIDDEMRYLREALG
jgi:DNA-directed RNA polymerase specialized sigma24 family protein